MSLENDLLFTKLQTKHPFRNRPLMRLQMFLCQFLNEFYQTQSQFHIYICYGILGVILVSS